MFTNDINHYLSYTKKVTNSTFQDEKFIIHNFFFHKSTVTFCKQCCGAGAELFGWSRNIGSGWFFFWLYNYYSLNSFNKNICNLSGAVCPVLKSRTFFVCCTDIVIDYGISCHFLLWLVADNLIFLRTLSGDNCGQF